MANAPTAQRMVMMRQESGFGQIDDSWKNLAGGQAENQHGHVGQDQAGKDRVDQFTLLDKEHGAGSDVVHHHGSQQHRRNRTSRNAEGQERDQSAADAGVVGGFRRR